MMQQCPESAINNGLPYDQLKVADILHYFLIYMLSFIILKCAATFGD